MFKTTGILAALIIGVYSSTFPLGNEIDHHEGGLPKGLSKCAEDGGVTGILNCAAVRTLKSMQHMAREPVLEIVPGVSLNNDEVALHREGKEISEIDLPVNPQEKASKLLDLLLENSSKILSGRTLKVKFPENISESISRALTEEGRKKKKGGMMMKFPSLMLGMGAKVLAVIPALIAGLGFLSTKALIIAKLALILAVIVFFQSFAGKASSLFSGIGNLGHGLGGGGGNYGGSYGGSYGPPTWTTNNLGGNQYPYARSIDVAQEKSAQDLAYSKSKQN